MRKGDVISDRFKCTVHNIYITYITPSTVIYCNESENLPWTDKSDLDLLRRIKEVKRDTKRFGHDNSEDAVTWNVFRFLETRDLLPNILLKLSGSQINNPEVIYWSYSRPQKGVWSWLHAAREEFELNPVRGSEPDIIVKSDDVLLFIEAKVTATNDTTPSNPKVQEKYETGGNHRYTKVFKSKFEEIAYVEEKYELMRLWLLGS